MMNNNIYISHAQAQQELEWVKAYSSSNLSNNEKGELLQHYLDTYQIPQENQFELATVGNTLITPFPMYAVFELFANAIGLQTEYIMIKQIEFLSIRMPKDYFKRDSQ